MDNYEKGLDELFNKWKTSIDDTNKFVKDGIVDKNEWDSSDKKILFILKEPNDEQDENLNGDMDLAFALKKDIKELKKYATWRNVFLWSHGILNTNIDNIIDFNEIHKKLENGNLNHIAVLNLKKTYGTSVADMSKIEEIANRDKEFILNEIELINPDIIVTANIMYILEKIIPKDQLNTDLHLDEYNDWINEWNIGVKSICIIKHYHPQCWNFSDEKKYNDCCNSYKQYLLKKKLT